METATLAKFVEELRKLNKKILITVIGAFVALASTVFAAQDIQIIRIVNDNGAVLLDVDGTALEQVTLNVLLGKEGMTQAIWESGELKQKIKYADAVTTNRDGKAQFAFILENSGVYTADFGGAADDEIRIVYADSDENSTAIDLLLAASSEEIMGVIDANASKLAIGSDFYVLNSATAADIVYKAVEGKLELTPEECADILDKAYFMTAVKNGTVTSVSDYINNSRMVDDNLINYYSDEYDSSVLEGIKNAHTIEEYDDNVFEKILLGVVSASGDVSKIKNIISEYRADIGLNTSVSVSDALCRELNKKKFQNIIELKSFINDYVPPKSEGSSGGGGGGGGSNSSSSSFEKTASDKYISSEYITKNEVIDKSPFDDIDTVSWAKEYIEILYHKGIVKGKGDNKFCPDDNVSREEFVKMLMSACKLNVVGNAPEFTDVVEDAWYYESVKRAYTARLINGISDNLFGVGQNILRRDIAVIINNLFNECGIKVEKSVSSNAFVDENKIADYALDATVNMRDAGIITGDDQGNFNPDGFATRAEVAVIISKIIPYFE